MSLDKYIDRVSILLPELLARVKLLRGIKENLPLPLPGEITLWNNENELLITKDYIELPFTDQFKLHMEINEELSVSNFLMKCRKCNKSVTTEEAKEHRC
jgi:hypothetical protein